LVVGQQSIKVGGREQGGGCRDILILDLGSRILGKNLETTDVADEHREEETN